MANFVKIKLTFKTYDSSEYTSMAERLKFYFQQFLINLGNYTINGSIMTAYFWTTFTANGSILTTYLNSFYGSELRIAKAIRSKNLLLFAFSQLSRGMDPSSHLSFVPYVVVGSQCDHHCGYYAKAAEI